MILVARNRPNTGEKEAKQQALRERKLPRIIFFAVLMNLMAFIQPRGTDTKNRLLARMIWLPPRDSYALMAKGFNDRCPMYSQICSHTRQPWEDA